LIIKGINPSKCLPVQIDVGTEREEIRNDPNYMGLRQVDYLINNYHSSTQLKNKIKNI
jgi:hypothetical protein